MAIALPLLTLVLVTAALEAAPPPRKELTTSQQVRRLPRDAAAKKYPVRIEGVVTHANPLLRDFFVQDRTAGIYVHPTPLSAGLALGDRVVVEGASDPGSFSPCVRATSVTRLGTGTLPDPHPFDLTKDESRWLDGQYVQVWGNVTAIQTSKGGQTSLQIFTTKGTGFVVIPRETASAARSLIGSLIAVRGVVVAGFNEEGVVIKSPRIFVTDLPKRVSLPAGKEPYVAAKIIHLVRRFVPDPLPAPRWVRVTGVVTASPRDDLLYIQDDTDGLEARLNHRQHYHPGMRVEITGLLVIRGQRISLNRAEVKELRADMVPPPRPVTMADLKNGARIGERVQFTGLLQGAFTRNDQTVLSILGESGGIAVIVPGTTAVDRFEPGSQVQVTGVQTQEDDPELMAQSIDDIQVLRLPPDAPLLTRERAGAVGAILAGVTILVAIWVITLRLRVRRQTRQIREQTAHEAALEARYRDLFEEAGDAVWITDREGLIVALNRAGETLLGLGRKEAAGRRIAEFLPPDEASLARASQVSRLGAPFELTIVSRTGETVVVEVSSQVLPDGGVQTIARNITERKRLQNRDLQMQKLEALGRLAGGIAHDFNNLLTVINGSSEILRDRLPDGEPARALAEEVLDAGNRAANLTRQLLAFSRQRSATPTPLDLNQAVTGSLRFLRRLIGEEVRIVTELAPDALWVRAEIGLIEQVLMNLSMNARDAMPKGGTLTLRTAKVRGGLMRLTVADTGLGMDEETRAKIYEPFFTTKPIGQGTGLGLPTVYGVVQTLGGVIRCTTAPGQGTVFEVDLPALAEPDRAAPAPTSPTVSDPTPMPGAIGTWGKPYTVLLVEDDEAVRGLARNILEEQGLTVLTAEDGPAALEVCQEQADSPLHLLITDVMMPNMTGAELVGRVRAERPELRVVFVSGYTADELPPTNGTAAEWDFVHKPFTPAELTATVHKALRQADRVAVK